MPKIAKLDPHVADMIAAGEVVERPGSVIKELLENAIDAGATTVTVEIQNGGMLLMRVADNGCGMAPEDAETAFLRHATSKIRTEYDLEAIGTLGFRGEALAATAAVSRISLLTREKGAVEGLSLELEAGEVLSRRPVGCPEGTVITVRDLFFNTPARLKFMKSDRAEGANVSAAVLRCALSHPELSIKYIKDGKIEFHTPGDGRVDSTIYTLLGREFSAGLRKVDAQGDDISVTGYISSPAAARGNRTSQYFYVNGRYVRSQILQAALEQAYKNSLFTGRFPACILYISLSKAAVDVNVHPAKTEVRFLNERAVFDAVYHAAMNTLAQDDEKVKLESPGVPAPKAAEPVQPPKPAAKPSSAPVTSTGSIKPKADFFKTVSADQYRASGGFATSIPAVCEKSSTAALHDYARPAPMPAAVPKPAPAAPTAKPIAPPESAVKPAPAAAQKPAAEEPDQLELSLPENDWRIIGEALSTYILVEQGSSLILIDKHAAHERLLFDRFMAQADDPMTQVLLTPVIHALSPADTQLLLENKAILEPLGLELDAFGESEIAVRQVPADIDIADIPAMLEELADAISTGSRQFTDKRDAVLHTMACKAAIKAGRRTEPGEYPILVQAVLSGQIKYCPHGRPVSMELTKSTLDKGFKRS